MKQPNLLNSDELAQAELNVSIARAQRRFEKRHGTGSVDRLFKMANEKGYTLRDIAAAFELSPARMSVLWRDLTGRGFKE